MDRTGWRTGAVRIQFSGTLSSLSALTIGARTEITASGWDSLSVILKPGLSSALERARISGGLPSVV